MLAKVRKGTKTYEELLSESKTSNVLERSSGKNKEVIIAVPKTSNVLERLNVS